MSKPNIVYFNVILSSNYKVDYISTLGCQNIVLYVSYIFMLVIKTHFPNSTRIFQYLMNKEIYSSSNKIAKKKKYTFSNLT